MENQDTNRILQEFIDLVNEDNEKKQKLQASKAYETIQDLAEIYVEKGMVYAIVKISDLDKELFLTRDYYEDLIDIYFLEQSKAVSSLRDAKIDLIETFGVLFKENAIDYLSKFAFESCPEQGNSLYLLVKYSKKHNVKSYVRDILKDNFLSLSEQLRAITIKALEDSNSDKEFIDSLINLKENILENNEYIQEKKWWEFWK